MYMVGTDAIHALRRGLEAARGTDFDQKAFHDELLSFGSVPVSLVAESLRGAAAARPASGRTDPC